MHVGARYYDAQVGRFVTRDTYLNQHPYLYCEHDPVNRIDPAGHFPWIIVIGVIVIIGGSGCGARIMPKPNPGGGGYRGPIFPNDPGYRQQWPSPFNPKPSQPNPNRVPEPRPDYLEPLKPRGGTKERMDDPLGGGVPLAILLILEATL
jgi:hypothetical protein